MIAKDKLKIVLSAVDMGQLAISYSQLDYEDDLTKKFCSSCDSSQG
jgi:hypothetical protein